MFENTRTNTHQGNIGEAKAIYELTRRGYAISRTLFDSEKYDLIADDGDRLLKIQVKTTRCKNQRGKYEVGLATSGGNTRTYTTRPRQGNDYDYLFVLAETGECWFIPADQLGSKAVVLGEKWDKYKFS